MRVIVRARVTDRVGFRACGPRQRERKGPADLYDHMARMMGLLEGVVAV